MLKTKKKTNFFFKIQNSKKAQILSRLKRTYRRLLSEANATRTHAASSSSSSKDSASPRTGGLTLAEACRILNVRPPQNGTADMKVVWARFARLFDANEPANGGSFYLQSKVLRARQRIEDEVRMAEEKAAREEELGRGWRPRLFR